MYWLWQKFVGENGKSVYNSQQFFFSFLPRVSAPETKQKLFFLAFEKPHPHPTPPRVVVIVGILLTSWYQASDWLMFGAIRNDSSCSKVNNSRECVYVRKNWKNKIKLKHDIRLDTTRRCHWALGTPKSSSLAEGGSAGEQNILTVSGLNFGHIEHCWARVRRMFGCSDVVHNSQEAWCLGEKKKRKKRKTFDNWLLNSEILLFK
jgi:hypothetical protein